MAENEPYKENYLTVLITPVAIIIILLAMLGVIAWNAVFRIIGGGIVGIIAMMICFIIGGTDEKIQGIAIGIYLLGAFFAVVVSLVKYGLTSWLCGRIQQQRTQGKQGTQRKTGHKANKEHKEKPA